jgi:3-isopropylmalate dehydratase small subunit
MTITDPKSFLDEIDMVRLQALLNIPSPSSNHVPYLEPGYETLHLESDVPKSSSASPAISPATSDGTPDVELPVIEGKVQRLGDFIDTDALAPNEALAAGIFEAKELGTWCLKYTHPEFRQRAKDGFNVVVAGKAFGVGSSRENAVTALQGTGVQAVIAKSFAFIYGRNQPNLGLLGFVITDERFYDVAKDGVSIQIDILQRSVFVNGEHFEFTLSDLEWQLVRCGGMTNGFRRWGKGLLEVMTGASSPKGTAGKLEEDATAKGLQW